MSESLAWKICREEVCKAGSVRQPVFIRKISG